MFHGKYVTIAKVQLVTEIKIVTTYVNLVDVIVTTRSKATEEHVFKDKEPKKEKNVSNWENEK
jgi:hypothetical protein